MSERFGDVVWSLIFSEIQRGEDVDVTGQHRQSDGIQVDEENDGDDIWEEERSWRDPSAHKLRVALAKWLDLDHRTRELIKVGDFSLGVEISGNHYTGVSSCGPV